MRSSAAFPARARSRITLSPPRAPRSLPRPWPLRPLSSRTLLWLCPRHRSRVQAWSCAPCPPTSRTPAPAHWLTAAAASPKSAANQRKIPAPAPSVRNAKGPSATPPPPARARRKSAAVPKTISAAVAETKPHAVLATKLCQFARHNRQLALVEPHAMMAAHSAMMAARRALMHRACRARIGLPVPKASVLPCAAIARAPRAASVARVRRAGPRAPTVFVLMVRALKAVSAPARTVRVLKVVFVARVLKAVRLVRRGAIVVLARMGPALALKAASAPGPTAMARVVRVPPAVSVRLLARACCAPAQGKLRRSI